MDFKKAKKIAEYMHTAERWKMHLKNLEENERYDETDHFGVTKQDMTELVESNFEEAKNQIKAITDEG